MRKLANGEKTVVVVPVVVDPVQVKRATVVVAVQDRHVLVATDEKKEKSAEPCKNPSESPPLAKLRAE